MLVQAAFAARTSQVSAEAACEQNAVTLDPSNSTGGVGNWLGSSLGQTFYAPETLITSITVWRPPSASSFVGARLYVTTTDSTISPPYPNYRSGGQILREGPRLQTYDTDPP